MGFKARKTMPMIQRIFVEPPSKGIGEIFAHADHV